MIPAADTPIGFALHFAFVCLSLAYFAALYRLLKGPTIPDRIIVVDLVASATIGIILTFIILTGKTIYINVALIIALIVFMGNVAFAKYLKKPFVMIDWIIAILIVLASLFMLVAALGIVKLHDVYMRMHAITKASSLSIVLFLLAVIISHPGAENHCWSANGLLYL